jgi:lantibiotic biosynthesis protein
LKSKQNEAEVNGIAIPTKESLLEAAVLIADRILDLAIWDQSSAQCNWMGNAISSEEAPARVVALGPDIYSGSAGIALVLGECFPFTGASSHRATAQAALTRSTFMLKQSDSNLFGFYGGAGGIGYVARRLGEIGIISDPSDVVDEICCMLSRSFERPKHLDVTGGVGGTILFLSSEYTRKPADNLIKLIDQCAAYLCERAVWHGDKCAWIAEEATGLRFPTPLGGYSHGTAGIATALFEAFQVTKSSVYRTTARAATAYDDSLFDPEVRNWRDARFVSTSSNTSNSFPVAWCHGAAGITLARIRAAQIDQDRAEQYNASILAGSETTASFLRSALERPTQDCTLCHGIAGLADIIRVAGSYLPSECFSDVLAIAICHLVSTIKKAGTCTSGLLDGRPHPSLMLGDAGIALQLLREASEGAVPSILLV